MYLIEPVADALPFKAKTDVIEKVTSGLKSN